MFLFCCSSPGLICFSFHLLFSLCVLRFVVSGLCVSSVVFRNLVVISFFLSALYLFGSVFLRFGTLRFLFCGLYHFNHHTPAPKERNANEYQKQTTQIRKIKTPWKKKKISISPKCACTFSQASFTVQPHLHPRINSETEKPIP